MKDTRRCDCSRPWPEMTRIGAAGPDRYYLCPACGCIRHEAAAGPGLLDDVAFYHIDDPRVPELVWREAHRLLNRPTYSQLGLFGNESART